MKPDNKNHSTKVLPILALFIVLSLVLLNGGYVLAAEFPADLVVKSIVSIETRASQGSGVIVSDQGHILTNAHVLDRAKWVQLIYFDEAYDAEIIAIDDELDLAILRANLPEVSIAQFTPNTPVLGSDVYAVGNPEGLKQTVTRGIISSLQRDIGGQNYIQTDAAINPGNSGGALCLSDGSVVGILTLKSLASEGIGFAIPVSTIKKFVSEVGLELKYSQPTDGSPEIETEPDYPEMTTVPTENAATQITPNNEPDATGMEFNNRMLMTVVIIESIIILAGIVVVGAYYLKHKKRRKPVDEDDFEITLESPVDIEWVDNNQGDGEAK